MSSRDQPIHYGQSESAINDGPSGSPEKLGHDASVYNEVKYEGQAEGRDQAQVKAALDTLNMPRGDTSDVTYGTPGEKRDADDRVVSPEEGKKRTQYFEDRFSARDGHLSLARERVYKESPVVAELRTNVIVKDEFTLVTDMSYHLSTRYARPESAVMVHVDHSACLLHAGSFEPAYILTISAISSQIQPTMNKRNAALIQSFMADALSVPPERGVLRFLPIPEENLASNGSTVLSDVERMERLQADENGQFAVKRNFARNSRKSLASLKRNTLKPEPLEIYEHENENEVDGGNENNSNIVPSVPNISSIPNSNSVPSMSTVTSPPPIQSSSSVPMFELAAEERKRNTMQPPKETKTIPIGALKGSRPQSTAGYDNRKGQSYGAVPNPLGSNTNPNRKSQGHPMPPPIPKDTVPTTKVSKRKSFLAVFRKA